MDIGMKTLLIVASAAFAIPASAAQLCVTLDVTSTSVCGSPTVNELTTLFQPTYQDGCNDSIGGGVCTGAQVAQYMATQTLRGIYQNVLQHSKEVKEKAVVPDAMSGEP